MPAIPLHGARGAPYAPCLDHALFPVRRSTSFRSLLRAYPAALMTLLIRAASAFIIAASSAGELADDFHPDSPRKRLLHVVLLQDLHDLGIQPTDDRPRASRPARP